MMLLATFAWAASIWAQELESIGPTVPPGRGTRGIRLILDRSVLGEWLSGDNTAIDEFLVVFRDSVRAELARMHDALDRGRFGIRGCGASAEGAALSMGARALADFVGQLFAARPGCGLAWKGWRSLRRKWV